MEPTPTPESSAADDSNADVDVAALPLEALIPAQRKQRLKGRSGGAEGLPTPEPTPESDDDIAGFGSKVGLY